MVIRPLYDMEYTGCHFLIFPKQFFQPLLPCRFQVVIDPGHTAAHLHPFIGDQALVHQLVQHWVQGTFLGFQSAAGPSLRLLDQLIAIHIF